MFVFGLGLLGSIFLSFGCLIAAFKSLLSLKDAYNPEARTIAIMGFIGGLIASAFFGWATIVLVNKLDAMTQGMMQ